MSRSISRLSALIPQITDADQHGGPAAPLQFMCEQATGLLGVTLLLGIGVWFGSVVGAIWLMNMWASAGAHVGTGPVVDVDRPRPPVPVAGWLE